MEYHGDLVVFSAVFPSMFHLFLVFERIFRYVFPSFPWFSEWARLGPEVGDRQTTLEPEISGDMRSFTQISDIYVCMYIYIICV